MKPVWSDTERAYMRRAIELATPHRPHPNPRVGCVIVDAAGRVVGEGAHRGVGREHAEQEALRAAGAAAQGGAAFVSLEPCPHTGRTPPCADALVRAGIVRVVAAAGDPDSRVRGRGFARLERAGIQTSVGLLEREAIDLDPGYHHHRRTGRPFVRAIIVDGLDGDDPKVESDLHALERSLDRVVTGTDVEDGEADGPATRRRLVGLAGQGCLYVGVRDEPLVARLRSQGLLDAVTVYTARATFVGESVWRASGYRVGRQLPVGSHYRVDLGRTARPGRWKVRRVAEARIPTRYGDFRAIGYESPADGRQHVAMVRGEVEGAREVLVRVHSECLTGDVFASLRCDCGFQLDEALRRIGEEGRGVALYIRGHEGRGIGLMHKLAAYALQEGGRDTVQANLDLGFPEDDRDYRAGTQMLTDLGVVSVRLLTNNPAKRAGIEEHGLSIVERIPLVVGENDHNRTYLRTKVTKLGHLMDIAAPDSDP